MPNPNLTSDRALVRYRLTKAQPPPPDARPVPVQVNTLHAPTVLAPPALGTPDGGHTMEEYHLDPPTNSVAEVERRWSEDNKDQNRVFVDADLLPVVSPIPPVEPVKSIVPNPNDPTDSQIVKERARGREELPGTVTEDEDAGKAPEGSIRPVKGDKADKGAKAAPENDGLDDLTVPELREKADKAHVDVPAPGNKPELVAALRAANVRAKGR